jgi:hypothetical protein
MKRSNCMNSECSIQLLRFILSSLSHFFQRHSLHYTKQLQTTSKEVTKKLVSQYGKDAANGVILISTVK